MKVQSITGPDVIKNTIDTGSVSSTTQPEGAEDQSVKSAEVNKSSAIAENLNKGNMFDKFA